MFALGCNKPDPNPELNDAIYLDMEGHLKGAQKGLVDAQKALAEHKTNMEKAKPQTGQIQYPQKRYWDTQKAIDQLYQQEKYWIIRISERKKFARIQYLKAFKEGKPWPDPQEYEEYLAEKRLRQARQQWDVRARLDEFKKDLKGQQAPVGK